MRGVKRSEVELRIRRDYLLHLIGQTQAKIRTPPLFQHYDRRPDLAAVRHMSAEVDSLDAQLNSRAAAYALPQ